MKIKLSAADKFFEAVAILSVLTIIAIIGISYPGLPDIIPNHFDFSGNPNQYGSKNTIWIIVAASVFLYMLTGIIGMFPESFNYPSQKTDKESQYKLGSRFLRSMRAGLLFFITLVCVEIVQSAKTGVAKGLFWLLALLALIIIGNLVWFAIQWKKIK